MAEPHKPDLGSHPHVSETPLRTGNPPETQADQENVAFRPPTWVVDRVSAGVLMLIIAAILLAVAIFVVSFLSGFRLW